MVKVLKATIIDWKQDSSANPHYWLGRYQKVLLAKYTWSY